MQFDQISDHKHDKHLYRKLSTKLLAQVANKNTKFMLTKTGWLLFLKFGFSIQFMHTHIRRVKMQTYKIICYNLIFSFLQFHIFISLCGHFRRLFKTCEISIYILNLSDPRS